MHKKNLVPTEQGFFIYYTLLKHISILLVPVIIRFKRTFNGNPDIFGLVFTKFR